MRRGPGFYIQKKLGDRKLERAQFEASRALAAARPGEDGGGVALLRLDAIGDFLLWLGCAEAYREIFPGEPLTLVCNESVQGIARATGLFHRVIPVRLRAFAQDPAYRAETLGLCSSLSFRSLVQTVYSRTYPMEEIAAAIPAATRTAIDGGTGNLSPRIKANTDRLYHRLIPTPADPFLMELARNAALVSALLGRPYPAKIPRLPLLTQTAPLPDYPYIAVFAGANSRLRQWPEEQFAAVLAPLMEQTGLGCLLLGSGEETPAAQRILSLLPDKTRVTDLTGKTSLAETVELVRNAALTIGNDSSGVHMAAATGRPSVCLAGQWEYGRFLPYEAAELRPDDRPPRPVYCADLPCKPCGALKNCYRHPACALSVLTNGKARCICRIQPDAVLEAALDVLKQ